jgi:eukaryotic-like serine/threonine-protein kinase
VPSSGPAPSPLAPPGGDPYLGTVLNNRFRIDAKLGEGGFGAVYKGTQLGIGRQVALKLLHPEMTRDQNLVARFRREGVVLCQLRDAHTITTYDFDQTPDGTLYIAMELLEGRSLHDVFEKEAPIDWRRMFKFLTEMATSLHEAHQAGIVHRDLKPENINIEKRPGNAEFIKVLDFGIAKVMRGDGNANQSPQLTATGQTLGTLEYMSPEQLMGKDLDGRSDVYALGVVAYELITGRLPFPGAVGPAALISAQLRSVPDVPSKALGKPGIPQGVDAVLMKMLEKNPKDRFADVLAMRVAVEQVLASNGAVPESVGGAAPAVSTPAPTAAGTPPPEKIVPGPSQPERAVGQPLAGAAAPRPAAAPAASPQPVAGPAAGARTAPVQVTKKVAASAAESSRLWVWLVLAMAAVGASVGALMALE